MTLIIVKRKAPKLKKGAFLLYKLLMSVVT